MSLRDRLSKLEAIAPRRKAFPAIPREHALVLGLASEEGYFDNLTRFPDVQEMFSRLDDMTDAEWIYVATVLRELIAREEPHGTGWSSAKDASGRARYAREGLADVYGAEWWVSQESRHEPT